jgi:uncharacterized membrane protein YhaH (DUF805 family)
MPSFDSASKAKWDGSPSWLKVFWIFSLVNFAIFWVVAAIAGGDAVNGYQSSGRYFLANRGHYTEVSREFFTYSRIHVYSVFVTLPAAMLCAFLFSGKRRSESGL